MGKNDNKKCICGSGKKYKHCCLHKKERVEANIIGHKEKCKGIIYDANTNDVKVITLDGQIVTPDSVSTQTYYERKSGKDKILNSVPGILNNTQNTPLYLARKYDEIWVVDTNTKQVSGETLSVTSIGGYKFKEEPNESVVKVSRFDSANLVFKGISIEYCEKFGWCKAIGRIMTRSDFSENLKIALVTDHAFDTHAALNRQEKVIIGETYLPKYIELLYASSEVGKEYILNKLIGAGDTEAKKIIRSFETDSCYIDGSNKIDFGDIPNVDIRKYL